MGQTTKSDGNSSGLGAKEEGGPRDVQRKYKHTEDNQPFQSCDAKSAVHSGDMTLCYIIWPSAFYDTDVELCVVGGMSSLAT